MTNDSITEGFVSDPLPRLVGLPWWRRILFSLGIRLIQMSGVDIVTK
jgi:hypothetical protein